MRSSVLQKLRLLALPQLSVSDELPFQESGVPRYTKNPRVIYVGETQTANDNLIRTLDRSVEITQETVSVTIYFSTDAKNPISTYETAVNSLRGLRTSIQLDGANSREVAVNTSYDEDLLITEVEYTLTRIT